MGVKTWILAHAPHGTPAEALAARPVLDEAATQALVARLFPQGGLGSPRGADLSYTAPREGTVVAGSFGSVDVLMSTEVAVDRPSELPARFVAPQGVTVLHASHSVVDWLAFAIWQDGRLQRALSVSPDTGVVEDIGEHLPFEQPYWAGAHPATDPDDDDGEDAYPLPFHPLELGEAALRALLGFQLEGHVDSTLLQPEQIRMLRFEPPAEAAPAAPAAPAPATRPWWKFWA